MTSELNISLQCPRSVVFVGSKTAGPLSSQPDAKFKINV